MLHISSPAARLWPNMGLFLSLITPHKSVSKRKGIFNLIYGLWGIPQNISPPRERGRSHLQQSCSLCNDRTSKSLLMFDVFIFYSRLCRSNQAQATAWKTTQLWVIFFIYFFNLCYLITADSESQSKLSGRPPSGTNSDHQQRSVWHKSAGVLTDNSVRSLFIWVATDISGFLELFFSIEKKTRRTNKDLIFTHARTAWSAGRRVTLERKW